ncbi:MAG: acyl-CoA dehydrogenase [Nitrospinota bacterium]
MVLLVPGFRRKVVTGRVFSFFKKMLPGMSSSEKEALEAGTVWWEGELFSGKPRWKNLLALKDPVLSEEEKQFLDGPVEELCSMLDDWKITDELFDLPTEVWDFLKQKGFFGMIIPKKYGGLEFSALAHSSVVTKIASRSVSAAVTVMVPNSLGPAELLLRYGTEEQKDHYLPRLSNGKEVPCFALTAPEAGSDAGSIPDTGIVCKKAFEGEQDVLGVSVTWEKRYITLGPVATVLGIAFKMVDPDHLLGEETHIGITLALIPTETEGVEIGSRHAPLNSVFLVGPNKGKDVFIPMKWLIGGVDLRGKGWKMLMECLSAGRSISLPALSTGSSKLASRVSGAYARVRKQFNMPIGKFEGIEEALARIGGLTYLIESARVMTAGAVDDGQKPSVVSAIVKYHTTELARTVINDAMDVEGGAAICMGPKNLLARIYQTIPISITVEGANILTRNMIIFGQGAIRCHPYVLKEMLAAAEEDPEKGEADFDRAFTGHMGYLFSNGVRAFFLGLTGSRLLFTPGAPAARKYFRHLTRMCAAFSLVADLTMFLLGGSLKRKERISARLGDVLSYLYLGSAVLKRFDRDGSPVEDRPFLDWSLQYILFTIQERLDVLTKNLPLRCSAALLRFIIFPFGKTFSPPSDKLDHKVADLLLSTSQSRDRLTGGIFVPKGGNEPLRVLEEALKAVTEAEVFEKRISDARRAGTLGKGTVKELLSDALAAHIVSEENAETIQKADTLRKEVIRVDDFPQGYWENRAGA